MRDRTPGDESDENKDESSILIARPGCVVNGGRKKEHVVLRRPPIARERERQLDYAFLTQVNFQRRRKYFFLLLRKPFNIAFDDKRDKHNKVGLSLVKF